MTKLGMHDLRTLVSKVVKIDVCGGGGVAEHPRGPNGAKRVKLDQSSKTFPSKTAAAMPTT